MTLYRRQGSRPSRWKRNAKRKMAVWGGLTNICEKKRSEKQRRKRKIYQKPNCLSEEVLQTAVKRRETKSKGEKEKYIHLNSEFQRIARRDKKAFLSDQCKEREKQ